MMIEVCWITIKSHWDSFSYPTVHNVNEQYGIITSWTLTMLTFSSKNDWIESLFKTVP